MDVSCPPPLHRKFPEGQRQGLTTLNQPAGILTYITMRRIRQQSDHESAVEGVGDARRCKYNVQRSGCLE